MGRIRVVLPRTHIHICAGIRYCWYRAAKCLIVWTKTKRGGELVLSNKINTLKFFQNLSIKSSINFFKHNNR